MEGDVGVESVVERWIEGFGFRDELRHFLGCLSI